MDESQVEWCDVYAVAGFCNHASAAICYAGNDGAPRGLTLSRSLAITLAQQLLTTAYEHDTVSIPQRSLAVLTQSVEEFDATYDLGVRVMNACQVANIRTVAEMARLTAREWRRIRNFGKVSLRRVREALEAEGLAIGALAPQSKPR